MKLACALLGVVFCGVFSRNLCAEPAGRDSLSAVAQGNNAFAVDLYKALQGRQGNLFFSPYSISTALAMTYAGARGETQAQMARTLHFGLDQGSLHPAYGTLASAIAGGCRRPACRLISANSLWVDSQTRLLPGFLDIAKKNYGASIHTVDFSTAVEAACGKINSWVAEKTENKIRRLLQPGSLDPATRSVLVNAVYFDGRWHVGFDRKTTAKQSFTTRTGDRVSVDMMTAQAHFGYAEDETLQVLEMPYEGKQLSMLVLLPKEATGLGPLEDSLTAERLDRWCAELAERAVRVYIPKITMTAEFQLSETLAAMGMTDAFSAQKADFSGVDGTRRLSLSAVFHKAYVELDERGTRAAAATGVGMGVTSVPATGSPPVVRADHPFIVLIRHKDTGCILFLGRMEDPREHGG
jgi:serpin B